MAENKHERVIILAPVDNDAGSMAALLNPRGFRVEVCRDMPHCCEQLKAGAGLLLFTEEALSVPEALKLFDLLEAQPAWSEIPLIVLTRAGWSAMPRVLDLAAKAAGSVTLLERPIGTGTLLRSVEVALRSRRRQYQVRDLIEEQRAAQKKLLRILEFDEAVMNNMGEGLYTVDIEGKVTSMNPAAEKLLGWKFEELRGRKMHAAIHYKYLDGSPYPAKDCPGLQVLKGGAALADLEDVFIRKDRSFFNVIYSSSPIREAGRISGLVVVFRDMSERKRAEEELKDTNQRLADLSHLLEKRVQQRTHQLEEQAEQLRHLAAEMTEIEESERKRLAQILHDHLQQLLVAAKMRLELLERKSPHLDRVDIQEVRELLQQAYDSSRSLTAELRPPVLYESGLSAALQFLARKYADQHKLTVHLSIPDSAEPTSEMFKTIIYHSIQELLLNAVKYAGVQECFLEMERVHNWIHVVLRDEGVGFNPSKIGRKGVGGFGLFSIRERMKALGGELKIISSPGKGSIFTIRIPDRIGASGRKARRGSRAKPASASHKNGRLTVLIADDHKIVRQSLASLLLSQPFVGEVFEAENGEDAISKVEEHNPHVVLMDLNMPKMNGIEATRRLIKLNAKLKIIGLSVQAEEETVQSMKKAGVIEYFSKNSDTELLVQALKRLSQHGSRDAE